MRRAALSLAILVLALPAIAVPGHPAPARTSAAGAPGRPNVLLIVTDDQRVGGGSVGRRIMPATRRWFRSRGRRFPRAFATTPLCCPSRASIMTGRYTHNHAVRTNGMDGQLAQSTTIQRYLDEAGYRTGIAGKYFNHWDLSEHPPYFDRWSIFREGYYNFRANVGGQQVRIERYSTDWVAARALRFLRGSERDDERPWFLYVAPYAPHGPAVAEPDYRAAPVGRWPGNPAVFERDRSDKPVWIRRSERTYEHGLEQRKRQLRTLMSVDDLVRAVFRRLSGTEELGNTLAIFVSDNGDGWAEHGWTFKIVPYTASIKVPLFLRWPAAGIRGGRDRRVVTNVDLAPTILDAAGLAPDPRLPMDGRSLLDPEWRRRRLLTEHWESLRDVPTWASIRKRRFQYVEYYGDSGRRIFREFYNLRRDPWQLRNLLRDGRRDNNPSRRFLRHLHERLRDDRRCTGITGAGRCP